MTTLVQDDSSLECLSQAGAPEHPPSEDAAVPAVSCEPEPVHPLVPSLAAWREQGLHRTQATRYALIESLARRAAHQRGAVRAAVDARLAALVQAMEATAQLTPQPPSPAAKQAATSTRGPLGALVDGLLARQAVPQLQDFPEPLSSPAAPVAPLAGTPAEDVVAQGSARGRVARGGAALSPPGGVPSGTAPKGELATLRRFRGTWSRLSAQQRLRQTLAQVPAQAGPLNSNAVVHRALVLMQEVSPAYLQRFVAYADALLWLEHQQSPVMPNTARMEARRKATGRGR